MVRRYQDLECWQLADELKRAAYKLLKDSPAATRDFDFARQLRRAASSGPANIAEGFAYFRHKESAKFVRVAKGSLAETHNHLGDGIDRGYWTAEVSDPSRRLANRAIGATTEWLKYLMTSQEPN